VTPLAAAAAALLVAVLGGNLVRIPLFAMEGGRSAPLLPLDLMVVLVLAAGLLTASRAGRLPVDRAFAWGLAFLGVGVVGVVTAPLRLSVAWGEVPIAASYVVRWGAYFGVGLVLSALLRERETHQLVGVLRVVVLLFAVFGILQSAALPGFAQLVYPDAATYVDWDPQGRRLVSTFLDPNFAGMLIVLGLCLWGGRQLAGTSAPPWEGGILVLALALTLSRSSALAGVVAAGVLLGVHGFSRRALLAVGGVGAALFFAIPLVAVLAPEYNKFGIDLSALQRLLSWQRAATLVGDHPVLGIGFNTLGFVLPRYGWGGLGASAFGLDGGLLFIASLTGVLGVSCFVMMLVGVVRSARSLWSTARSADERALGYAVAASVAAVVVHATFVNTLLLPLLLAPCWVLWATPRALLRVRVT